MARAILYSEEFILSFSQARKAGTPNGAAMITNDMREEIEAILTEYVDAKGLVGVIVDLTDPHKPSKKTD